MTGTDYGVATTRSPEEAVIGAGSFSEEGVAAGCVHLIGALQQPPVFLRMDTSGLGLISHGAAAAAIGTHSEHRHLFPLIDDGGGHIERLAFVIPDLVGY